MSDNTPRERGELMRDEHYPDAEAEIRAALRLDPEDADLHVNLGKALGRKGDLDGVIAEYREGLRLNPSNDSAHYSLGLALRDKGEWDGAVVEYREALRLNPSLATSHWHFNLGVALGRRGDPDGA